MGYCFYLRCFCDWTLLTVGEPHLPDTRGDHPNSYFHILRVHFPRFSGGWRWLRLRVSQKVEALGRIRHVERRVLELVLYVYVRPVSDKRVKYTLMECIYGANGRGYDSIDCQN